MNLRPPKRKRRGSILRMELTPMIDVIFLLLIYFFLTNAQQPPEAELAPALAAQRVEGGGTADFQPQIVDVVRRDGSPAFQIGGRVLRERDQLFDVLSALPKDSGVFVRAGDDALLEWTATALQTARDAGFVRVTYVPRGS
jgi:biopolymer transport protein ExbD